MIILSAALALPACSTLQAPSPQVQQQAAAAALSVATVAYVTRATSAEGQAKRAQGILHATHLVRSAIDAHEPGSAEELAQTANRLILQSKLAPNDRALAQAIVVQAMLLVGDADIPQVPTKVKTQAIAAIAVVERAASVFVGDQALSSSADRTQSR
jgi:hypothetical protein